jgi:hypothetical protein
MSENLRRALEANRDAIEAGLAEAQQELAALRERERELERLITRARAALDEASVGPHSAPGEHLTLHEALRVVLDDAGNRWMTVRELADEVNGRALYRKRDGSPVEANQVHARTRNYEAMFEKNGPRVRLRTPE